MPPDVKFEKILESYISEIEEETDLDPDSCPILEANHDLLMMFKNETHRKVLEDIGHITKNIDTSECSCDYCSG